MSEILLASVSVAICFVGMVRDIRTRKIPNLLSILGVVCVGVILTLTQTWAEITLHLYSLVFGFVLTFVMFSVGWIGGGDAKLVTFVAFAVPLHELLYLGLWISIIGGLQGLYMIVDARLRKQPLARGIPYGVAIFLGVLGYWGMELFMTA